MTASRRKCEPCCSPGSKNKKHQRAFCVPRGKHLHPPLSPFNSDGLLFWWFFLVLVTGLQRVNRYTTESRSGFFFWQNIDVRGGGPGCSLSCRCSMRSALNKVGCQWGPGGDFDRKTQGSCLETQVLWLGGKSVRRQAMFQADGEQVTQRWLWFCDQCFLVLQKLQLLNENKWFRSEIQHHVRTEVENKSLFC